MEIKILCCYIYINCVIIPYLDAKPFSLNDIIDAERRMTKSPEGVLETPSNHFPQSKKTSSLKYKKTFKIKSPSRPKKLKHLQRLRNKRKRLTSKREVNQNEKTNNKYIPLLRNIGLLFDNILNSGSSESYDNRKYKRNQFSIDADEDTTCACVNKNDAGDRSYPQKETAITPATTEVETETFSATTVTTTASYNFTNNNISGFGRNKNIPSILTRNTSSVWRNNNRLGERSGSTHNRSIEGHISGIHGNNKHNTSFGERQSDSQYHEKNTNSHSRDNTDSHRSSAGIRGIGAESGNSKANGRIFKTEEYVRETNETSEDATGNLSEHEREIEFEVRRNETESGIFLPEFTSRLREYKSQEKNTSIRITESDEKIEIYNLTSNKRVSGRNGSDTEENKKDGGTNKAVMSLFPLSNSTIPNGKMVMIFDGYSIARDVNGENKLKEKAIHILS